MIECSSKIDRVTVYARGAIVTRAVTLPAEIPAQPCVIQLAAVSPVLDTKSVRAKTNNGRSVLGIETRWIARSAPSTPSQIQKEIEDLEHKHVALNESRSLLYARTEVLRNAHPDPRLRARKRDQDHLGRVKDSLKTSSLLGELLAQSYAELRALDDELPRVLDALTAARLRLAQAKAAERESVSDPKLALLVHLGAEDPNQALASLELEYTIEAARWWPTYKVRFSQGAHKVKCALDALVAQASGEDWTNVLVSLSTADLVRDARLPLLPSLRLGRAQPAKKAFRPPPDGLEELFAGYDRAMQVARPAPHGASGQRAEVGDTFQAYAKDARVDDVLASEMLDEESEGGGGDGAMPESAAMSKAAFGSLSQQGAPSVPGGGPSPYGGAMPSAPMSLGAVAPLPSRRSSVEKADTMTRAGAPMSASMPPPMQAPMRIQSMDDRTRFHGGEIAEIEPGDEWLDFDELTLRGEASGRGERGRLQRVGVDRKRNERQAVRELLEHKQVGGDHVDPRSVRGAFDYRYDSVLRADIPGDSAIHRISMLEAEGESKPLFRVVAKEVATVFREAELRNPFDAPLLVGPAEVFYDEALLTRAKVPTVDKGGIMHIGLGMEERIRVARNSRVHEGSAGLLGGSTQMDHTVSIELSSSLGEPATVVVIDRLPYAKKEDDIEVTLLTAKPKAEAYTQAERGEPVRGGLRWHVEVPAGAKAVVEFQYKITFSSKLELNGGNRRD